jgi:hypothetical protein
MGLPFQVKTRPSMDAVLRVLIQGRIVDVAQHHKEHHKVRGKVVQFG